MFIKLAAPSWGSRYLVLYQCLCLRTVTRAADDEPEELLLDERLFFTVVDERRFFFTFLPFTFTSAFAMLSSESLRAVLPQMFFSKAAKLALNALLLLDHAESVWQYWLSVLPSMFVVLYILPLYMLRVK